MSFARLLPSKNDDDETKSLSETGVIVKDIVPRSMIDNDDCTCTCSCCPTIFDWCIKDACGLFCGIMTWMFFLYGELVFVFVILTPKTYSLLFYLINFFIFHVLEFLAISSHFQTMFSNPGAVPLKNATPENLLRYESGTTVYRCAMCQSIKPVRAHHCSVCKRCIKRMDHHCVFVNNCVGQNNQKYFILFTFYTFMLTIYGLLLLGIHIKTCMSSNWAACPAWSPPVTLLFMISFGLEGLSFLSFTGIMTCTQLYSIYTDTTQIELFKGVTYLNRERNSFIYSLKIVFGSRMGLTWLNPFSKPIDLITQDDERIIFDI